MATERDSTYIGFTDMVLEARQNRQEAIDAQKRAIDELADSRVFDPEDGGYKLSQWHGVN